ncbi:hypothetical protein DFH11DRAFT_147534 [Phellopilus nigrolimitatus]|nr:hypothetical protein DFH11DRAFT_147534 [Phellopilus nigrolimitatus]
MSSPNANNRREVRLRSGNIKRRTDQNQSASPTHPPNSSWTKFSHFTELLSLVFIFCLPSRPSPRPTLESAPLLLIQVCKRWRDVALSTPRLWASLELKAEHSKLKSEAIEQCHSVLRLWTRRSGAVPLSLVIMLPVHADDDKALVALRDLVSTSLAHCRRWSLIALHMESRCIGQVYRVLGSQTPLLKSLSLITISRPSEPVSKTIFLDLTEAKQLQNLIFRDRTEIRTRIPTYNGNIILKSFPDSLQSAEFRNLKISISTLSVPSTLRILDICGAFTAVDFLSLSSRFPRLENLQLEIQNPVYDGSYMLEELKNHNVGLVRLPYVHTFILIFGIPYSCHDSTSMLEHLSLPSISHFSVYSYRIGFHNLQDRLSTDSLGTFLLRSHAALKQLLLDMPFSEAELVTLLQNLPTLEELCLVSRRVDMYPELTDRTLAALTLSGDSVYDPVWPNPTYPFLGLCPILRKFSVLEISREPGTNFSSLGVIAMVLSRCEPRTINGPVQSALTDCKLPLKSDDKQQVISDTRIQRCISENLRLSITVI